MRKRLTSLSSSSPSCSCSAAGFVRSFILRDLIREQEGAHVQQQVVLVAEVVAERGRPAAAPSTADFLAGLVGADSRLEYTPDAAAPVRRAGQRLRRQRRPRGRPRGDRRRCPTARSP